jgi:hypothetical protein
MKACPGCGLANYNGLCPWCRGDQDAYERELVSPFPSLRSGGQILDDEEADLQAARDGCNPNW